MLGPQVASARQGLSQCFQGQFGLYEVLQEMTAKGSDLGGCEYPRITCQQYPSLKNHCHGKASPYRCNLSDKGNEKEMIVSEYHHFVMPNKLVDLDIENQWLLTSHSQRLGDKRSFTTWHLAKQFKPKWDPASGSSCQSAGNTEVRGIQDMPCTRHHRVKTTGQGTSLAVR